MDGHVLIVEDEQRLRDIIRDYFTAHGADCDLARDGTEALELLRENDYDAILLDVLMPNLDGFAVCRAVREHSGVPILFLTALGGEEDVLRGYALGADDYVTKPFSVVELVARVEALFRRVGGGGFQEDDSIRSGPFRLNARSREVTKNGVKIELTQIEYGILKAFMSNVGRALSRDDILEMVWGHHYVGELKIVDVNIRRLRIKIEDNPASPRYIVTVRGFGYMWEG